MWSRKSILISDRSSNWSRTTLELISWVSLVGEWGWGWSKTMEVWIFWYSIIYLQQKSSIQTSSNNVSYLLFKSSNFLFMYSSPSLTRGPEPVSRDSEVPVGESYHRHLDRKLPSPLVLRLLQCMQTESWIRRRQNFYMIKKSYFSIFFLTLDYMRQVH